jgi:hypothetical protein
VATAAVAVAAGPPGHDPVADGLSLVVAAAADADHGAAARRRPGRRAARDGQPAHAPAHIAGPQVAGSTKAEGGAADPTPGAASGGAAGRGAARSNARSGGRAVNPRARRGRDRTGSSRDGLAERAPRPVDAGPGRRSTVHPWATGAAERHGHDECTRNLQADAGDPISTGPWSRRSSGGGFSRRCRPASPSVQRSIFGSRSP